MIRRISTFFYRISTGWVTLAALVIFFAFMIFVFPGPSAGEAEASTDMFIPDIHLFYTAGDLYRGAAALTPQARVDYVQGHFTYDLAWPLVYFAFLATSISWLLGKGLPAGSPWRMLNLTPLAAMLFDLLENATTSLVYSRYPAQTPAVDALAGFFTLFKWVFVGGSFVVLLFGLLAAGRRWLAQRRNIS